MTVRNYFPGNEITLEQVDDGLSRKVAAHNDNLMMDLKSKVESLGIKVF